MGIDSRHLLLYNSPVIEESRAKDLSVDFKVDFENDINALADQIGKQAIRTESVTIIPRCDSDQQFVDSFVKMLKDKTDADYGCAQQVTTTSGNTGDYFVYPTTKYGPMWGKVDPNWLTQRLPTGKATITIGTGDDQMALSNPYEISLTLGGRKMRVLSVEVGTEWDGTIRLKIEAIEDFTEPMRHPNCRSVVKEKKNMIEELRSLDIERLATIDIDRFVGLLAFGEMTVATYNRLGLDAPEWLGERMAKIEKKIRFARTEALEKQAKDLQTQIDKLKSAEEKRSELQAKLAKIREDLQK